MDADETRSNGKPHHLESVFVAQGRWLRTVAFARLNSWDAVDDVMQEVAVACSRQQQLASGNAGGWLYSVTVRQALLHRRRMGRERRRLERHGRERNRTAADGCPDPLAAVLAAEQAGLVQSAMRRLAPRERELLLLKYTENWTCQELADRLGSTASAIENRLFRARQKLRKLLADYDVRGNQE